MHDLIIRCARPPELTYLADIERKAASLFPAERVADPAATLPMAQLQAALAAKLLFVAVEDDQLRGFAACRVVDRYLHLDELSVHPDYGRRGIGQALVSRVLVEAQQRQWAGVTLTTFADLPWNAPFYARRGFVELPEQSWGPELCKIIEREQMLGFPMQLRVVMQRRLDAQQ